MTKHALVIKGRAYVHFITTQRNAVAIAKSYNPPSSLGTTPNPQKPPSSQFFYESMMVTTYYVCTIMCVMCNSSCRRGRKDLRTLSYPPHAVHNVCHVMCMTVCMTVCVCVLWVLFCRTLRSSNATHCTGYWEREWVYKHCVMLRSRRGAGACLACARARKNFYFSPFAIKYDSQPPRTHSCLHMLGRRYGTTTAHHFWSTTFAAARSCEITKLVQFPSRAHNYYVGSVTFKGNKWIVWVLYAG